MMYVVPLQELQALARAVALDGRVVVRPGVPGAGWFWRPREGVVDADPLDLRLGPPDLVRGLVCHEAAHAAVTRYLTLVPREIRRDESLNALFNALEDCRVEAWLQDRFPGTMGWMKLYNERLFPADAERWCNENPAYQYCLGAVHDWWHRSPPRGLHPAARHALETTVDARRSYVAAQPPAGLGAAPDRERHVVQAAREAYEVAMVSILPVYRELVGVSA